MKVILTDIRSKNQKIIQEAEITLSKFSEEEIQNEYSKYLQEKSQKRNSRESLEMYNKLMYEYMIARENGEFETIIDSDAREQLISDEIKDIETEQSRFKM